MSMSTILATYTFGYGPLTVLEFAILFLWIWVAVGVVFDIFRSRDLSNGGKALWMLFIIIVPYIGVIAYLILRGHTMHEHREQDVAQAEAFQRFQAGGGVSATGVEGLAKLAELHDRGKLTDSEFEQAKAKLSRLRLTSVSVKTMPARLPAGGLLDGSLGVARGDEARDQAEEASQRRFRKTALQTCACVRPPASH